MNKQPVGILIISIKEGRLSGCFTVPVLEHGDMDIGVWNLHRISILSKNSGSC